MQSTLLEGMHPGTATVKSVCSFLEKVKVRVAQSCPPLCDPTDYTVPGILQARILEWVAFPFSRDLPNPGIESRSLCIGGGFFTS